MTDPVPLPRAVVEKCVLAAQGCLNAATEVQPADDREAKNREYVITAMRELESQLLDALAAT